jgi:hypothetical protein
MAARRLLIVMLVLLGLSTLAAALVPQHALRGGTTATTTTQPTTTATTAAPAYVPPTSIPVGGKKFPVVFPVHVGQQLTLLVRSRFPTELAIPAFGLVGFASPTAPARFSFLPDAPGTYGIVFSPSGKVAGQIKVVAPGWKQQQKQKQKGKPKSPARAGSGRAR